MRRGIVNKTVVLFTMLGLLAFGGCESLTGGDDDDFVAVTNISGVSDKGTVGTALNLTGTVEPANATNKTIAWSVQAEGTNAAGAAITGNTLTATGTGTVVATASIANGAAPGTAYTRDFTITITATLPFVAVTDIIGVPEEGTVGTALNLTGTVEPANATNKTIAWSVKAEGTNAAGAAITGNTLTATGTGTVVVTASIPNGAAEGAAYTRDFSIAIKVALPSYRMVPLSGGTITEANTGDGNTTNWAAGANEKYQKPYTMAAFSIGETEVT
jgi:endo-1,4-beta-xylanase